MIDPMWNYWILRTAPGMPPLTDEERARRAADFAAMKKSPIDWFALACTAIGMAMFIFAVMS